MKIEIENEKEEKKKYGEYDDYEIKDAARTLKQAEEIREDKEKMKYVKMCLEEGLVSTKKAIKSIKGLREVSNEIE